MLIPELKRKKHTSPFIIKYKGRYFIIVSLILIFSTLSCWENFHIQNLRNNQSNVKKIKNPVKEIAKYSNNDIEENCDFLDNNPEIKAKIESIDNWMKQNTGTFRAPSAVLAFVHGNDVLIKRTYNTSPDRLFEAASHSKFFTMISILQLSDRGVLDVDEPISKYLPVKIERAGLGSAPVTIRHVLSHTSGLRPGYGYQTVNTDPPFSIPIQAYQTGRGLWYSNDGYRLLQHVITHLTGRRLSDYVRENILIPLEMPNADSSNMQGACCFRWSLDDMIVFLKLFINRGEYKGRRIIADLWFDDIYKPVRVGIPLAKNNTFRGICFRVLLYDGKPYSINHAALWPGTGGYFHFFPAHKVGFIIMTDSPTANLDEEHRIDPIFAGFYVSIRSQLYELSALLVKDIISPADYRETGTSQEIIQGYLGVYINPLTDETIEVNTDYYNLIVLSKTLGSKRLLSNGFNKFYPADSNDEFFFYLNDKEAYSVLYKKNLYVKMPVDSIISRLLP